MYHFHLCIILSRNRQWAMGVYDEVRHARVGVQVDKAARLIQGLAVSPSNQLRMILPRPRSKASASCFTLFWKQRTV